ncbi:MAG: hypothetical protein RBR40_11115 [Tenuifilaceae bacterium]|nr:hypothetical protein [Tenuifilaceae bacterium]
MKIKSLKYLALAMFAGSVMLTSCEKDPEVFEAPTVTFNEGPSKVLDITEGTAFDLSIDITIGAPGKIEKITIERSKLLKDELVGEVLSVEKQDAFELTEVNFKHSDNIKYNEFTDGTIDAIEYTVIVKDRQGETKDATFTVTMGEYGMLSTEIVTGEIWKIHSLYGKGCWDLKADVAVTAIENDVDVVASRYMINNNGVSTLDSETNFDGSWSSDEVVWFRHGAPNEPVSAKGNGTKFVKVNDYDYAMAIKEVAMSLFDAAGEEGQLTAINAPAVDDIYIAVLGEEIYVIKITEIVKEEVATAKLNSGVIRFTYKK